MSVRLHPHARGRLEERGATEDEVVAVKNFGRKSLDEVKEKLTAHGLSLRQPEAS